MTDAELTARELLAELQHAVAAKDLDRLSRLFDDEVVLFGTAAANLDRAETVAYLARVVGAGEIIRWAWDRVTVLVTRPGLLTFAVVGSVWLEDDMARPVGDRTAFRLTCVALEQHGRWRLRHFHGSVPEAA